MLEVIRKRRNSIFILLAFVAIIIVFIFWGVSPNTDNGTVAQNAAVAKVDGEAITSKEYSYLYKRELEYYKNTFKNQFNEEMIKQLNLRQRTLDVLINRLLALKEAKAQGIEVSAEEVQEAIKKIPAFAKDGAFDKETYFKVLSSNRLKPDEFEKSVQQDLVTTKVRDRVLKDVSVPDDEMKAVFVKENRKVDFNYVSVDGSRFKSGVTVSDAEAEEYFKKSSTEFTVPTQIKAVYAGVKFNDLINKVIIADEELKRYYDRNLKQFEMPEEAKARHILIRPDNGATDKDKAKSEARKKAEDILAQLKGGAKFADLAKANSADPGSAKQGGDLGWFPKGVMVKSFEEAVFSLKKGEVSGVVETEFGFHIIMLDDKKDSDLMPFNKAKESIKRDIIRVKAMESAKQMMTAVETSFKEAKNFEEAKAAVAKEKDVKIASTELFTADDKRVALNADENLGKAVFDLKAGENTGVIETAEGVYIAKALEKIDSHLPGYAEAAEKVKAKVAERKADEAAQNKAGDILKAVKGGEDFAAVAKREKYPIEQTGYFSKIDGFIPKIEAFAGDKDKLFELTSDAPYYPEVLGYNNKYYVMKLNGIKEADEAEYDARKEEIKSRLLAEKQDEVLGKWLKDLKAKAKIEVNEELL